MKNSSLALALILGFFVLFASSADAQTPTSTIGQSSSVLEPMKPVTTDVMREVRNAPIVDEPTGPRIAGIVRVLAREPFNTGMVGLLDPTAELLRDSPTDSFGIRSIVIRAADPGLDRLIGELSGDPSVVAASKSFIAHGDQSAPPNDPSWSAQNNAGLGLLDLTKLWTSRPTH